MCWFRTNMDCLKISQSRKQCRERISPGRRASWRTTLPNHVSCHVSCACPFLIPTPWWLRPKSSKLKFELQFPHKTSVKCVLQGKYVSGRGQSIQCTSSQHFSFFELLTRSLPDVEPQLFKKTKFSGLWNVDTVVQIRRESAGRSQSFPITRGREMFCSWSGLCGKAGQRLLSMRSCLHDNFKIRQSVECGVISNFTSRNFFTIRISWQTHFVAKPLIVSICNSPFPLSSLVLTFRLVTWHWKWSENLATMHSLCQRPIASVGSGLAPLWFPCRVCFQGISWLEIDLDSISKHHNNTVSSNTGADQGFQQGDWSCEWAAGTESPEQRSSVSLSHYSHIRILPVYILPSLQSRFGFGVDLNLILSNLGCDDCHLKSL